MSTDQKLKRGFWRTERTDKGVRLITTTGRKNDGRVAEYLGIAGNRKEASWDGVQRIHTCCGSKVGWRHKITCQKILNRKDEL